MNSSRPSKRQRTEPLSNKATLILCSLDTTEITQYRKYLNSPYFNERKEVVKLFEVLVKDIKKNTFVKLSKEMVWKKTIGNSTYNDLKFRRLCSDLTKLAEDFLGQQVYESNPVNRSVNVLLEASARELDKFYNLAISNAQKNQKKQSQKDAHFYYHQHLIELYGHLKNETQTGRDAPMNIGGISDNLDYYYFAEKLKYFCLAVNYQKLMQSDYEMPFIQNILDYLAKQDITTFPPPVAIYYHIALTLTQPNNESHYEALKERLAKHASLFNPFEAWQMYGYALNYCIRKINNGQNTYLSKTFQLYEDALKKEVLLENEQISPWHYKNIVVIGLRLKEFDKVENFLEHYKEYLPKEHQENAYTFNKARLFFVQEDYDKVISLLQVVEYQDPFYVLSSKAMLLKTYYELDEVELAYSLINSFTIYLRRNKKIVPQRRNNYLNFIKFIKKLIALPPRDNEKILTLKTAIQEQKRIADKNWLLEKLEGLL